MQKLFNKSLVVYEAYLSSQIRKYIVCIIFGNVIYLNKIN